MQKLERKDVEPVAAPAGELRVRYGAPTLEEAFFAATGRGFAEEIHEEVLD